MESTPVESFFRRHAALVFILLASALVRIYGIWDYLPTMDEVQFLIISQGNSFAEIWNRAQAEVHPPLVWFIRHFTLMLSADFFVQRLISVVFGLLTVLGAYALGKAACHNKRAGIASAFLMAFTPAAIIASVSLRNYVFLLCFMVWAVVFLLRWRKSGRLHNVLLYALFITLACASHFSGFLVAAACGIAMGTQLLLTRRFKAVALFGLVHLPLAALAWVFYTHYLAPGTTIPMWKQFMLTTGFTPAQPEKGLLPQLIIPLIAYFSPLLQAVHSPGFISDSLLPTAQMLVLAGSLVLMAFTLAGLYCLWRMGRSAFGIVAVLWVIALGLSLADLYPFSANRHNIYLLPFYNLPLAALFARLYTGHTRLVALAATIVFSIAVNESIIWQDEDFCLKKADFEDAQYYLHNHLMWNDVIVTGPMGAYFYLIYAHDGGKVPYNDYGDKPSFNGTTLLAPFASPYKPYSSYAPFRENLKERLQSRILREDGNVWFIQYGWKNQELWTLMQCPPLQPFMENFWSRDGVVIFSVKEANMELFLQNDRAWEACYFNYKPLVIGTPFKAVTTPKAR